MQKEASTLHVLRTPAELERISLAWQALWLADPDSTPFQHPAWLIPWWHAFAQADLRVYTLWQGETLLALLPLYVLDRRTGAELLLLGAGTSDYLDALSAPDCTDDQLRALLAAALAEPGWAVAHLTQLRTASRLRGAIEAVVPAPQRQCYAGEHCSTRPAERIAQLPRRLRADVLYFRNAATSHGRLALVDTPASLLGETLELLVRFHTERWAEAGEPGVLADPAVLAHHREAIPLLHTAGLLCLQRLELAGEAIAVLYGFTDPATRPARTQYLYLMGYALSRRVLRPGMLLTALSSQQAAEGGIGTLDMLRGEEAYKQFWRVEPRPTFGFAVLPGTAQAGHR